MISTYKVALKVCDPNGKVIVAKISQIDPQRNRVELPYLDAIKRDKKIKMPSGKYVRIYNRASHKEVLITLTKYLESLFMKELANEDSNSSKYGRDKPSRIKKQVKPSSTE